jgi:hypothetical protein
MAYNADQIEDGPLKKMISRKQRKALKKSKVKKIRKTPVDEVPMNNRYNGWAI